MVVPDSISADDLGAFTIGDTWHHILNDQLQSIDSRIVQGADGQIYLIQGSQGWLLVPDSIAQPDLNALTIRGQIYGSVAAGWFINPIVVALPPPPIAAAPGPAPSDSTPDTLTDDVRQSILDAITRANNGWVQAKATLITENLSGAVAGQELLDDTNEVIKLRNAHHLEKDTQQAFNVVDVTLDSPGHATVHTTETWLAEIDDPLGKLIQSVPPTSYNETYTVEFQDGAWIVTLDQLQPA